MQGVYWNLEEPSPPFLGVSGGMGKDIRKRLERVRACQVLTKCVTLKVSVLRCLAQGHAVVYTDLALRLRSPGLSPSNSGTRAHILATNALPLFGILPPTFFLFS